jgi:predicted amidohydrolase YtcJ
MGHRDIVGAIEIGHHADLIVTGTNPFEVPVTEVHRTKVILTLIDGKTVFDADSPPLLIEGSN